MSDKNGTHLGQNGDHFGRSQASKNADLTKSLPFDTVIQEISNRIFIKTKNGITYVPKIKS